MRRLYRRLRKQLDLGRLPAVLYPVCHAIGRALSYTGALALDVEGWPDGLEASIETLLDNANTAEDVTRALPEFRALLVRRPRVYRQAHKDREKLAIRCLKELIAVLVKHEQGPHAGCDLAQLSVPHAHVSAQ